MDHFNVPKKVNRHVLKALGALSGGDRKQAIGTTHIIDQVKHQMRNLVPVANLENAVQKSLKNLSEIGLIERRGMYRYALGRCAAALPGPSAPPNSKSPDRRVFRGNDPRRCSKSTLDPNMKRGRHCSDEESLSGDDFDRTRKRMRTNNKQVRHCGRWAYLPRVRQHNQQNCTDEHTHRSAAIDTPLLCQDLYLLHHQHAKLQELGLLSCCRDDLGVASSGMININNPVMDFMLANITPSPSLEISEITDDVKNIVDVRKIVETPPLQQQDHEIQNSRMEQEIEDYEEAEAGVQTEDHLPTQICGYNIEESINEVPSKNTRGIKQLRTGSKIATNQNQMPSKSCTTRRTMNETNSQMSSKSLLLDSFSLYLTGGLGITAGAHRLWAHRSYKAKWPLRLILMIFNTIAFQDAAYHWARDHRVHHKYSETDADPHNATRGFFFSHIGWLLCKKHPQVKAKGKGMDLADLRADKILMFQKNYYMILMPILCFVLPTLVPMFGWKESFLNSWFVVAMFRWCFTLNATWLVNSAAHKFGGHPYDRFINPSENKSVAVFAFGEGWHNYHHVFPWDYKTAELGGYSLNLTKAFIDFFAKVGWAYDLKTVSRDIIEKRVKRTGDGSHATWGWGDKDQSKEEIAAALITHKKDE